MSRASRRVRRFERDAILRAKEFEYRREQSDSLLSSIHKIRPDDVESDQHRRELLMKKIQQILSEENQQSENKKSNESKTSRLTSRSSSTVDQRDQSFNLRSSTNNKSSTSRSKH